MKKLLPILLLLCCCATTYAQPRKELPNVTVKLGSILGNHMVGDSIVKVIVHPAEILANPRIIPDSPGVEILDYKCSILSSDNNYWGPFVLPGSMLDYRLIDKIKDVNFVKGRIFLENIHVRYKGFELMANNLIIEFAR